LDPKIQQVIFHNLGTGIADAPIQELQILQNFLDNLERKTLSGRPHSDMTSHISERDRPKNERTEDSKSGHSESSDKNLLRITDELKNLYVTAVKEHHVEKKKF